MTLKALVIDDDAGIVESVADILESLGHNYDSAETQEAARGLLEENEYSYVLLDLEVPVRKGRLPRVQNGENLLAEIKRRYEFQSVPVIIMTGHGTDTPELAVEMMKKGAADYVTKPFPARGKTLDRAIHEALTSSGRMDGKARRKGSARATKFSGAELVIYSRKIELARTEIPISPTMRKLLIQLSRRQSNGKYVSLSGDELAARIGCKRGQNGVSGTVRDLRNRTSEILKAEAGITCERQDIIQSGKFGYHFNSWITIREAGSVSRRAVSDTNHDTDEPDPDTNHDTGNDTNRATDDTNDTDLNERQQWVVGQLANGVELRVNAVVTRFGCATATAKRDLAKLKQASRIEFVGPSRTGHYRLKTKKPR
ncbi:MAG: hypothetical protein CMJ64_00490 [Planctomycetaceae bacterium]|nr:hypothetical protein [Planctomycetaceae bacterium]